MADVANLEAAFERTTINDENDDQVASTTTTTTYHKAKVLRQPHPACRRHNQLQTA